MIFEYFRWHYSRGFSELIEISRNFLIFLTHFFSFKLLLATFFLPLKRISEHYEGGLHIESLISTFIVNALMRIVGMVSRAVIIVVGFVCISIFMVLSFAFSVIWLLMPFLLISLLASAFFLIYVSI